MKRNGMKPILVLLCLLAFAGGLTACNGEQVANNVLKSAEATYGLAHKICLDVAHNPDMSLEQKKAFKAKAQPAMRVADVLIRDGLVAYKVYVHVKTHGGNATDTEEGSLKKVMLAASAVCREIPTLVYTINTAAKGFGYDKLVVPDEITNALK